MLRMRRCESGEHFIRKYILELERVNTTHPARETWIMELWNNNNTSRENFKHA